MGKDLVIELEQAAVVLGDPVNGSISVTSGDHPTAGSVRASLVYAEGRTERVIAARDLPIDPSPRHLTRLSFSFPTPIDALPTFSAPGGSVTWTVRARLDVPWAVDPKSAETVTVLPRALSSREELPGLLERFAALEELKVAPTLARRLLEGCGKGVVTVLLVPLLVLVVVMALPLIVPVLCYQILAKRLIRTRLRRFELVSPPATALMGEWVPARVRFELRKPIQIEHLTVRLRGTETWTSGSGKSRHTHHRDFVDARQPLLGPGVLSPEPGKIAQVEGAAWLQVPPETKPTSPGAQVAWRLEAELGITGWPDPKFTSPLRVLGTRLAPSPAPAGEPLRGPSRNLIVVGEHEEVPFRVDHALLGERVWPVVIAPALGVACLLTAAAVEANDLGWPPFPESQLSLLAGVGLLLFGLGHFGWKLTR